MGHTAPLMGRLRGPQDLWYLARALAKHRDEFRRGARFRFLHRQPGMTGAQAALAFVLENRGVCCAVFGATRLGHLRENLEASGLSLPEPVRSRIRAAQGR
jgi:1-deoxyxylulose-5-phosphate synthase